jgi:hypothetical protein
MRGDVLYDSVDYVHWYLWKDLQILYGSCRVLKLCLCARWPEGVKECGHWECRGGGREA